MELKDVVIHVPFKTSPTITVTWIPFANFWKQMPRGEPWEGPDVPQGMCEAQCVAVPERPLTSFPAGSTWRERLTAALCISEQILFLHWS